MTSQIQQRRWWWTAAEHVFSRAGISR